MSRLKWFLVGGALLFIIVLIGGQQGVKTLKNGATAYLFGYPLVLMAQTQEVMTAPEAKRAPVNHFTHIQYYPDHKFREVVRPNNDTLYSIAWIDLSSGPLVLSVPDTKGRYYVMPFMDAYTNVFATIGQRETGTGPGSYLVVGPGWQGEPLEGIKTIHSPTNMTWLIGRIQANGLDDFENVFTLQEGFTLSTFENWKQGKTNSSVAIKAASSAVSNNTAARVEKMSAGEFFANLSRLMGEQPPSKADAPAMEILKGFGIVPGKSFNIDEIGPIKRILLEKAVEISRKKLQSTVLLDRSTENNWAVLREGIGIYGTDYTKRTFVALIGLGALPAEEAAYPNTYKDIDGNSFSGKNKYVVHFNKDETPPVDAFWSFTMYDERGFLIDNPIQRYAIGDRDKLEFNPDGSLDILVQNKRPEKGESNWLPAPAGVFNIMLRLYLPKEEFLTKKWTLPPVNMVIE